MEKVIFCIKFGNQINLENNKNYLDEKKRKYGSKIKVMKKKNIREKYSFEEINITLLILYFLIIYCFTEKLLIEKAFIKLNDIKILFIIRNKSELK